MSKRKLILSMSSDAKTVKGEKLGFYTGILYLAPSDISGYQTCPMATKAGCREACLYTAGRGAFNSTQVARVNKTKRFFNDRDNFMLDLEYSINAVVRKAGRLGLTPLIRLNGTSDIPFENIPYKGFNNIFEYFSSVQFYDYTKIPTRKNIPANYDLTFSYSGVATFEKAIAKASINNKLARIAVVFDKVENIPNTFMDRKVLSGDNSDVRHLDPKKAIIALYAKGKAKKDLSGFVVRKAA
jgi:hypothetical protein